MVVVPAGRSEPVAWRPCAHSARFPQGRFLGEMEWVWALVLVAVLGSARAERNCRVSSFRVKENFDKARVGICPGGPGAQSPRGAFPTAGSALPAYTKPALISSTVRWDLVCNGQEGP